MNIQETELWTEIGKLSLSSRERAFDKYGEQIEEKFNCKIVDRNYGDLARITNSAMPVKCDIRNICYLKEFVPKQ